MNKAGRTSYTSGLLLLLIVLGLLLSGCDLNPTVAKPTTEIFSPTPSLAVTPELNTSVATVQTTTSVSSTPAITTASGSVRFPGKLVVESENQIFLLSQDSNSRVKIGEGTSPLFSPDGRRIAYTTESNNRPVVRIVGIDGSGAQDLCPGQNNYLYQLLRWSPRDRFIALAQTPKNADAVSTVVQCSTTSKTISPIGRVQGTPYMVYDWTPDGDNTIWLSGNGKSFDLYFGDPEAGGAGGTLVLKGNGDAVQVPEITCARFSPDGKTLAVSAGKKILFFSVPGQKSPLAGRQLEIPVDSLSFYKLAWSPDGVYLATTVIDRKTGANLKLVSLDDKNFGKFQDLAAKVSTVDWSRQ